MGDAAVSVQTGVSSAYPYCERDGNALLLRRKSSERGRERKDARIPHGAYSRTSRREKDQLHREHLPLCGGSFAISFVGRELRIPDESTSH